MSIHVSGFHSFLENFVKAKLIKPKGNNSFGSDVPQNTALLSRYHHMCKAACMFRLGHSNLITCLTSFFWKKNPVRLQKKSHLWCLTDESGFEIFCQTPKKKKKKVQVLRIFFVRVIQSTTGSYHHCSRA